MKIEFPSKEFDDALAAVCHGAASNEQCQAINELLRNDAAALDVYIFRLELHSRLASEREIFASDGLFQEPPFTGTDGGFPPSLAPERFEKNGRHSRMIWSLALAASVALLATAAHGMRLFRPAERTLTTSKAVAMLNRTADAQWRQGAEAPRLGAPLDPGLLRLEAGLAEVIFYSGARLVIEGPADVRLVSQNDAFCQLGRLVAEVPVQARGFRVQTPHIAVTDLGTSFGLEVKERASEVHVFKGNVKLVGGGADSGQILQEGTAAVAEDAHVPRLIQARPASFASLMDLQARAAAAAARRHDQWQNVCKNLETDPSLVLHFDFENVAPSGWQLRSFGKPLSEASDATLVGCQWTDGRWPEKRALEFQSVSDRVRLTAPGEFQALTLTAWVCVKGLDREINSLFMSDGFEAGTIHWVIRRDGVLGMTVIGSKPGEYQIVTSPPAVALDKFGTWLHLAVRIDGASRQVTHFVNGGVVSEKTLKIAPPFRIGAAELGNWNPKGFPRNDPFMIRNFSGAMDDFCVLGRALSEQEIQTLYTQGKPR